jgi:membrane protease YdiL (CAAX protease family)
MSLKRLLEQAFLVHWSAIDRARVGPARDTFDWRPFAVLITVAVSLTVQEYWGDRGTFSRLFPPGAAIPDQYYSLAQFAWWTGWRFAGYVLLPALVILAIPGERLRDCFVGRGELRGHAWIYGLLLVAVMPLVVIAARSPSFHATYPFYRLANRSPLDFWIWEAMYMLQFASLEFFFRGFMLKGLEKSVGSAAIFVMVVPYCMIHYGKPMLETLGAVGAGIILGTLAMRTRSIWGGVVLHCAVALAMDLLALQHCPPAGQGPCASEQRTEVRGPRTVTPVVQPSYKVAQKNWRLGSADPSRLFV